MSENAALPVEPVPAKRRQVLAGAREVFSELGFERASVDVIAARAGVSKATVYHHYADKKALYVACVTQEADEMRAGLRGCLGTAEGDLEQALQALGERILGFMLRPEVVALYRQATAEAMRFPDLGRTIFEQGPVLIQEAVAAQLRCWAERGALRLDDARGAAVQFLALCQGDLFTRSRLGVLEYPVDEQVRATVRRAVRTFLRAYRA
jgi:AcrR family transcriptional regulator